MIMEGDQLTAAEEKAFKRLVQDAKQMGITLSEDQLYRFQDFYRDLVETNKVMNLTAITEPEEVVTKHFLDSLSIANVLTPEEGQKILDLGTGGGFPGMPMAIAWPKAQYVLADSLNKRIQFLNRHIEAHNMTQAVAVHGRAEELAKQSSYREQFDLVVSRAVANLSTLCEYTLPFVKVGGYFVSYKSGKIEEELNDAKKAIAILGGKCRKVKAFTLQDTDYERSLIVIQKVKETPKAYPRKAGTPSKLPLGAEKK